jgi:hypothetical protein
MTKDDQVDRQPPLPSRRCWGITNMLRRCKNYGPWLFFCGHHWPPSKRLIRTVEVFGAFASVVGLAAFFFPANKEPRDLPFQAQLPQRSNVHENVAGIQIYARYDLESTDRQPYGAMFWTDNGVLEKAVLLPRAYIHMHSEYASDNSLHVVPARDISNDPKLSLSVVAVNDGEQTGVMDTLSLDLIDYHDLPPRRICFWNRKGLTRKHLVTVQLDPTIRSTGLIDPDHVVELQPAESFPVRVDILGAPPGLYRFHFRSEIHQGSFAGTIKTSSFLVASPAEEATADTALHIFSNLPDPGLAERLLTLGMPTYLSLVQKYRSTFATPEQLNKDIESNEKIASTTNSDGSGSGAVVATMRQVLSHDPPGIRLLAAEYGFSGELLSQVRILKTLLPDNEDVRELEIEALLALDRQHEATLAAIDFDNACPNSPLAQLALWSTNHKLSHLNRALILAPDDYDVFHAVATHVMSADGALPSAFKNHVGYLSIDDRHLLCKNIITELLARDCGTLISLSDMRLLRAIDEDVLSLFTVLPEYDGLYAPLMLELGVPRRVAPSPELLKAVLIPSLIHIGRIELALRLIEELPNAFEMKVSALVASRNFERLADILRQIDDNATISGQLFVAYCLSAIWAEDWDRFDSVVRRYGAQHPNACNLVRAHYNAMHGNNGIALKQLAWFYANVKDDDVEPFESRCRTVNGLRRLDSQINTLKSRKEGAPVDFRHELLEFFPSQELNTLWTRSLHVTRGVRSYAYVNLHMAMLREAGLQPFDMASLSYYRLPNGVAFLEDGHIANFIPTYGGMTLSEAMTTIAGLHGKEYVTSGVYGKEVRGDRLRASIKLHDALVAYWNNGALDESLQRADDAIALDEEFFDAWRLRLLVCRALGLQQDIAECSKRLVARWPTLCRVDDNGRVRFR